VTFHEDVGENVDTNLFKYDEEKIILFARKAMS
jgi:hypothetical protein